MKTWTGQAASPFGMTTIETHEVPTAAFSRFDRGGIRNRFVHLLVQFGSYSMQSAIRSKGLGHHQAITSAMHKAPFFLTAIVLLAGFIPSFPMTGVAQEKTPGRSTPYPEAPCDVEPRTLGELIEIEADATPIPDTTPITFFLGDLPTGVPVDSQTKAGITRTLQQWVACNLAGDGLRLAAVLADGLLEVWAGVSAIVTWGGFDDPHPAPGRTVLVIFLQEGNRWLIDGVYEQI